MNEIMKFEYEGNEVTFLTGENIMVNATQMAKKFKAKPDNWLRTDQAQRMIDALSISHKCDFTDLVQVKAGAPEVGGGTLMHKDVALIFAQWLSPEFYIWCNDMIFYIFRCGIEAAQEEINKAITYSMTEFAKKIKNANTGNTRIGRTKVFQKLRQEKILDKHNKPNKAYLERGWFELEPTKSCCYVKRPKVTEEGWNELLRLFFPIQQQGDNTLLISLIKELQDENIQMLSVLKDFQDENMLLKEANEKIHGLVKSIGTIQYATLKHHADPNVQKALEDLKNNLISL